MNDLKRWLEERGLGQLAPVLMEQDIDFDVLADLTESDLEAIGLSLGQRKRLMRAIAERAGAPATAPASPKGVPAEDAAERRQITVMFCDLVGSVAMSANLDPEDLREVLRQYQQASSEIIDRFDGRVFRYFGDGILACFGFPHAHEDAPERAVRAALDIVTAVGRIKADPRVVLQVRIGIATGLVVVGDIVGSSSVERGALVGETPNLAARLQGLAEPNEVVIAPTVRALLGTSFQYRDKGEHVLKGIPDPVRVWAVEGSSGAQTRFEAIHGTGALPLVGREGELSWLRNRWDQAREGKGQLCLVAGDAGFGKSHLVHAFVEEASRSPCTLLQFQCSAHHDNTPYYPLVSTLTRAAGLTPDEPDAQKLSKLERFVGASSSSPDTALPLIANLLSIAHPDVASVSAKGPGTVKAETFRALASLAVGRRAERPLLIVVEDAHWMDPTSWEFTEYLIERIAAERILMVVTTRHESRRQFPRRAHVSHIRLARLSAENASEMLALMLNGKSLPKDVQDQILARTDGVPLFVEELTKMLLESNLVHATEDRHELARSLPDVVIPPTLQDSLMARLDHLAPVKEVAQVGAVLGREFDYELLAGVVTTNAPAELDAALSRLAEAELLFASGKPPRATYTFKHALVQDAAYSSMLHSRRRALHARVAEVLETKFPERAFLAPELMARHCEHGGLIERAAAYWCTAAERSLDRSAVSEALTHVERGMALASRLGETPARSEIELKLEVLRGSASIAAYGYTARQTGRAFSRARDLCNSVAGSPLLFQVLHGQWLFHLLQAQVGKANAIAGEMLEAAEREQDPSLRVTAHRVQGTSAFWLGRFEAAREHLERALAMHDAASFRQTGIIAMFDVRVVALDFLSLTLLPLGFPQGALEHAEQAVTEARKSGALITLAVVLQHGCLIHQLAGNRGKVVEHASQLLELSEHEGYPFWRAHAHFFEHWAAIDAPDVESVQRVARAREEVMATGGLFLPYYSALLAELLMRIDEVDTALTLFDQALEGIESSQERWFEAEVHRMRAEQRARAAPHRLDAAIDGLRDAVTIARRQGARLWELRASTSLAQMLHRQGDEAEARRILEPIYRWSCEQSRGPDTRRAQEVLQAIS